MKVVYAKQEFPDSWTSAIFLAGPTPRAIGVPSWRPDALRLLAASGFDGVVMVPEPEGESWGSGSDAYVEQIEWERKGLDLCDVILFWVPRTFPDMMGLTTNVEFGLYTTSRKIVLGAPDWAQSVRYLEASLGTPRLQTLEETVDACQARIRSFAVVGQRHGGERHIPLHIWTLESFQAWYQPQVHAGNRLDGATILFQFSAPETNFVFAWVIHVNMWITAEQRSKTTEFVFGRTDIATVCLYRQHPVLLDTEIVLIREFRPSARTTDGYVHELPGGSSFKQEDDPLRIAADEVHEETGLIIDANRFRALGSRQLMATLSAHHAHLFAAPLSAAEMDIAKRLAATQTAHGNAEDTEITFVEVRTLRQILAHTFEDWSTVGMIAQALLDERAASNV